MQKRLKLAIVSDEFFDPEIGRMGGFGWAARQVARCFNDNPDLGVDPVFVSCEHYGETDITSHNTPLIRVRKSWHDHRRRLREEKFDLMLMIDYRKTYRRLFAMMPRTPIIVWARDPRTLANNDNVRAIIIPGREGDPIVGAGSSRSNFVLDLLIKASALIGRGVQVAYTANFLKPRIETSYAVKLHERNSILLPNILDLQVPQVERSERPKFAFLGRLDPYKRPWLVMAIAEQMPDAEFVVMGQSHFSKGGWEPDFVPENVRLAGHADEESKARELASSWAVVNTSVHEGLAVSLLEALKCETPIVSSVDPEEMTSRFGCYVGDYPGSGMDAVPRFVEGLTRLCEDRELRDRLGRQGREWVEGLHNKGQFLAAFAELCSRLGIDHFSGTEGEASDLSLSRS